MKNNKTTVGLLIFIILAILSRSYFDYKVSVEENQRIIELQEDIQSLAYESELQRYCDSMEYITDHMPDHIYESVIMTIGENSSSVQIAEEYIQNKQFYDKLTIETIQPRE